KVFYEQELKLKALNGSLTGTEFITNSNSQQELSGLKYQAGDQVMVSKTIDNNGLSNFLITDYARQSSLWWLALLFSLLVIAVGRLKGLRALLVLALTFLIILNFIIPQIVNGLNPILISIGGALTILILAVYLTEGFNKTSHLAVASIFLSLVITGLLASWFSQLTKLTGLASEEALFLLALPDQTINLSGLLMAGIIIGALGVLDDVVISQVASVKQIINSNTSLTRRQVYNRGMKVGISHLSSMVNTLFLAYAGAALPLLLLFKINRPLTGGLIGALNNEMIATEIVRALTGSIGLVLAVPITTWLAAYFLTNNLKNCNLKGLKV
ncbi:MAG: YibE/F family protein, partial [Patescibacteria group bacterium]